LRKRLIAAALVGLAVVVAIVAVRHGLFSPRPVPSVAVTTIKGEQLRLGALNGNVVLVNFWATTCAVCLREMPKLAELFEKYQLQGYRTVAVAMPYDPPNRVLDYVKRHPLPFDVALDVDGTVLRAFGDVPGTPTSFLVDKRGNIIRKYLGEPDFADLEQRIEHALVQG
jgi:peroxiredoxin